MTEKRTTETVRVFSEDTYPIKIWYLKSGFKGMLIKVTEDPYYGHESQMVKVCRVCEGSGLVAMHDDARGLESCGDCGGLGAAYPEEISNK